MMLAPDGKDEKTPGGGWIELVGASYDRTIHVFEAQTTREQDERFVALYNDKRNVSHFNFFLNNCADFSKNVLNFYFPHAVHKNYICRRRIDDSEAGARSLTKYGKKHPEMETHGVCDSPGSGKPEAKYACGWSCGGAGEEQALCGSTGDSASGVYRGIDGGRT